MNIAKAIEQTMTTIIRQHAEIGDSTQIRPWQSLNEDLLFDEDNDRSFPAVDIRFAAPRYDENQVTLMCAGAVTAMTTTNDDVDHQQASAIFEALYEVVLSIFRGSMGEVATTIYDELKAGITTLTEDSTAVNVGGITLEDGVPPDESDNTTQIGIGFAVHFSYA